MPYRRLPNTDSSRLKSLRTAFERGKDIPPKEKPYSQSSLQNINVVLPKFDRFIKHQKEAYKSQTAKSSEYNYLYKKARNYVSHFIQVLNLAIIRGDLKKEARDFFNLEMDEKKLPVFKTEQDLIKWGDIILEGEQNRIGNGGNPMTNPTIGIVKVHYEKFIDAYRFQKTLQENYVRETKQVAAFRPEVDRVILQLWNEIEASYALNDEIVKRNICREFGLIYFFRRNETIPLNENVPITYRKKRVVNKDIVKNLGEQEIQIDDKEIILTIDKVKESKPTKVDEATNFQYSLF